MDYLELLNGISRVVKANRNYTNAHDLGQTLAECGLDSLDTTLLMVNVCEVFGIPEHVGNKVFPRTYADIVSAIETHHSRMPQSVAEALDIVA